MSFREIASEPNGAKLFAQGLSLGNNSIEGALTVSTPGANGAAALTITQTDAPAVPTATVLAVGTRATGDLSGLVLSAGQGAASAVGVASSAADCNLVLNAKGLGQVVLAGTGSTAGTSFNNQPITGVKAVTGGDAAGVSITSTAGPLALAASAAAQDITFQAGAGAQIVHNSPVVFGAAVAAGDTVGAQLAIGNTCIATPGNAGVVTFKTSNGAGINTQSYIPCSANGVAFWIPCVTANPY